MLDLRHFFDKETYTLTYLVYDKDSLDCILIDPVWNYDQSSSTVSERSVNEVLGFIDKNSLRLQLVLETHAHADHLSGAQVLKKKFPEIKIGIGKRIIEVQKTFKEIFNLPDLNSSGAQFDLLFDDNEEIKAGSINIKCIFTPGHTPACASYLIDDMLFVGDALFMPDYGTGRCDFPLGSSSDLYESITKKIFTLPDETKIYTCHDYLPNGRELRFQTTVAECKKNNIQLNQSTSKREYVEFRNKRDAMLKTPKLLLPSIQVNINGGNLPNVEENNVSYLKIPVRSK